MIKKIGLKLICAEGITIHCLLLIFCMVVLICGCNTSVFPRAKPSCTYIVSDGKVTSVTIKIPYNEKVIKTREDADQYVNDFAQFLQDLKTARDQLAVVEK